MESIKATQITVKRCGVLPYFIKFPVPLPLPSPSLSLLLPFTIYLFLSLFSCCKQHLVDHMEGLRVGKEGRASLNSVIDTVYHKVAMTLFSWLEAQGEKELEKFRCIARLGMTSPLLSLFYIILFCLCILL